MKGKIYGYYSQQAARKYGTTTYTTPNGGTAEVTFVSEEARLEDTLYKWDDACFVSEVVEFVPKR